MKISLTNLRLEESKYNISTHKD